MIVERISWHILLASTWHLTTSLLESTENDRRKDFMTHTLASTWHLTTSLLELTENDCRKDFMTHTLASTWHLTTSLLESTENDQRKDFMINLHESYVAQLGFELATLGVSRTTNSLWSLAYRWLNSYLVHDIVQHFVQHVVYSRWQNMETEKWWVFLFICYKQLLISKQNWSTHWHFNRLGINSLFQRQNLTKKHNRNLLFSMETGNDMYKLTACFQFQEHW